MSPPPNGGTVAAEHVGHHSSPKRAGEPKGQGTMESNAITLAGRSDRTRRVSALGVALGTMLALSQVAVAASTPVSPDRMTQTPTQNAIAVFGWQAGLEPAEIRFLVDRQRPAGSATSPNVRQTNERAVAI